jgi:competence protein ComEC
MMGLAQVAGLAAVLCVALGAIDFTAGVFRALSVAAGFAAHVGATVLVESTSAIDLIPWAARRLPPPSAWILALYFSALATWIGAHARARQEGTSRPHLSRLAKCASIVTLAAIVLMIAAPPGAHALPAHRLSVVFIDVGQGDATLIRFPEGRSFLVDTGGVTGASRFDFGSRVVVPAIWARGVSRLDGLAITHGDPDHLGGAPGVVRDLRPRHLWEGIDVPRHAPTRELRALASSAGASTRALGRGWRAVVDGVSVRVWHPPPADWERPRVRNDDSLVIEIRWADVSILLTGDVGIDVERELVPLLQPAPIRVVKVAHHGSRSSSAPEFLEAIRPAVAVVSAGRDNRYGHPAERVLRDYARVGARLFRTDRDGAVTLTTDGREVAVTAFRAGSSMVTVRAGTASPSSIPLRALPATDPGGAGLPRPRRTRVSESAP